MSKRHNVQWENDFQRAVVIGMLLGDGSLSKSVKSINSYLSCYHSEKQYTWLEQKHKWLGELARPIQHCAYLDKRDGKTRSGARFHTISTPILTELHTLFYPGGKKFLSQEVCATINEPVTLAILIGDDGSWNYGVSIATKQFSYEENENLANRLNLIFSLHCEAKTDKYPYIRIPGRDVPAVRSLVMPYLPSILSYKVGGESHTPYFVGKITFTCQKCGNQFEDYASARRQYCSHVCQGGSNWLGKGRRIEHTCDYCGKLFVRKLCQKNRFCCKECYWQWKTKRP